MHLARPKVTADYQQRETLEYAIRNEVQRQQDNTKSPLTWQEKGKIARDMIVDKVYTSGDTGGLMPLSAATAQEQQNAVVWVGNQQVRMMDIPPKYGLQATEELQTNGMPTTRANIAAWWLKKGKPIQ